MKLLSIHLKNFRCFEDFEFQFPSKPGLFLLTGQNKEIAALGSNALGKTTLMDALMWILYNKTSKGQRAASLLQRGKVGGYSVSVSFELDNKTRLLERSWSPNKQLLDGVGVTDKEIEDLIGLTPEQFLSTIYFSQAQNSFIDLGAAAQLSFLSDLFQLDKWTQYADAAKQKIQPLTLRLAQTEMEKESQIKSIEYIKHSIEYHENLCVQWKKQHTEKQLALLTRIEALYDSFEEVKDCMPEVIQQSALEDAVRELQTQADGVKKQITACTVEYIQIETRIEERTKSILQLDDAVDTECPHCFRIIDNDHVNDVAILLHDKQKDLESTLVSIRSKSDQFEKDLLKIEKAIKEKQVQIDGIKKDMLVRGTRIFNNNKRRREAEFYQEELERLMREDNPHIHEVEVHTKRLEEAEANTTNYDATIAECELKISQYEFWAKRFPQVRLSILNEVINELEIHFNQAFNTLGLHKWSMNISTERLLKNESTKNELTIRLLNDGQEINLDSLSGGERQRIRLCVNIGMSEMIKARCGVSCNLLMFDEPCASLSQEGIDHLLQMLSTIGDYQQVLLAEHRVLNSEKFSEIFHLEKNANGISSLRGD